MGAQNRIWWIDRPLAHRLRAGRRSRPPRRSIRAPALAGRDGPAARPNLLVVPGEGGPRRGARPSRADPGAPPFPLAHGPAQGPRETAGAAARSPPPPFRGSAGLGIRPAGLRLESEFGGEAAPGPRRLVALADAAAERDLALAIALGGTRPGGAVPLRARRRRRPSRCSVEGRRAGPRFRGKAGPARPRQPSASMATASEASSDGTKWPPANSR